MYIIHLMSKMRDILVKGLALGYEGEIVSIEHSYKNIDHDLQLFVLVNY